MKPHGRSLSTYQSKHPLTSTRTAIAQQTLEMVNTTGNEELRMIVKRFCGIVWAHDDEAYAFKREDGRLGRDLLNDYNLHKHFLKKAAYHVETSHVIQNTTLPSIHQR
jgi:hypothetical protein